ncbi:hypothetical protein QTI66_38150 [Variovorax sp. J22R133]|uniref:hypothetical protein n=1 Tax=Variovorax brevis TaxID=3053503 RepID=UPI0025786907|nr:hypothetical protein [Variovorax sp. J22R133]MDM0117914.1 hypothetical protein [Variovorax sp. J22R133]
MSARGLRLSALSVALCVALSACGGSFEPGDEATSAVQGPPAPIQPAASALAAEPVATTQVAAPRPAAPAPQDLAARVARLEAEVATLKVGRGLAPDPVAPAAPAHPPETAETTFRQEETDPAWSRTATQQVRQAIGQVDPVLFQRLQTVECRTRNCRLEFAPGDDANSVEALLPRVITELDSAFAFARTQAMDHGTGRLGTVLFLSR